MVYLLLPSTSSLALDWFQDLLGPRIDRKVAERLLVSLVSLPRR